MLNMFKMSENVQIDPFVVTKDKDLQGSANDKKNDQDNLDGSENYTNYASAAAAAAAAQMQYMQQQQMMMAPGNYLPFVMPPAYQMIIQQQQQQQQHYLKNRYQNQYQETNSDDSDECSPLNLQISKEEQTHNSQSTYSQMHSNVNNLCSGHEANNNYVSNSSPVSNNNNYFQHNHNSILNFNSNYVASMHRFPNDLNNLVQPTNSTTEQIKSDVPPPPKRPLTPYMRFSKYMWQQVKTDNPGLSVCEIGATIGRMWRELSNEDKQRHNDDFTLDKVRYDTELKQYLKDTGLRSRDLIKIRAKNKAAAKAAARRPVPLQQPLQQIHQQSESRNSNRHTDSSPNISNSQFGQSFFPLGMPMPMLSSFPQMWGGQQYTNQQQMIASMQLAQQHSLYLNHQNFESHNHVGPNIESTPTAPSSMYLY